MRTAEHIVMGVMIAAFAAVGCEIDQEACVPVATTDETTTGAGGATMAGGVGGGLTTGTGFIDPCLGQTQRETGTGGAGFGTGLVGPTR